MSAKLRSPIAARDLTVTTALSCGCPESPSDTARRTADLSHAPRHQYKHREPDDNQRRYQQIPTPHTPGVPLSHQGGATTASSAVVHWPARSTH